MSTYWGLLKTRAREVTGRRVLSVGPYALSVRGSALVGVMAIITAVLLVGVAIFILGHAEGDIVEYSVDDSRAFYIAEGGLERMMGYLVELELADPAADPVGTTFPEESRGLGGGHYDVKVVSDTSGGSWLDAYTIVSTGYKDGAVRQVKASVVAETFAMYSWFIGKVGGGFSWFRTGEEFEGPVHVNGTLGIDGDPVFHGPVRAGLGITLKPGSNPTFDEGYELFVEQIPLPSRLDVLATVRVEAIAGGYFQPKLGPNKAYWEVDLLGDLPGETFSCTPYDKDGVEIPGGLGGIVDLSTLNGAVWFDDDIRIQGTLDGQVTIGVDGNIEIWGDIKYADLDLGGGPAENCDDVLGMIAAGIADGDVIIVNIADNRPNCEVHGVMMALSNTIRAEDYQDPQTPRREDFIIYGGLIAQKAIHLAQYNTDGVITSGYNRVYHFDSRMITMPPPFFPFANGFSTLSWEEVVPVVL